MVPTDSQKLGTPGAERKAEEGDQFDSVRTKKGVVRRHLHPVGAFIFPC